MRHTLLLCALLLLSGCGPLRETYTVIHGAWLTDDGASVVVFAETGVARLNGNSFSAVWNHDSEFLSVWRLDRRTGKLRQIGKRPTPAGFAAFYGPASPEQWPAMDEARGKGSGTPLPDCNGALTRCAARTTPGPFTVRDQREGRDRGRRIVDPATGVTLQGLGRKVVMEPYALRTADSVDRARGESVAATAARALAAARANLAQTLAKTGALSAARSATIVDGNVGGRIENFYVEYAVEPAGLVTARLSYGNDPPLSLRWTPSVARGPDGLPATFACEADQADAARWIAGCRHRPRLDSLDPELVYLVNSGPQLAAAAARDAAYQGSRRGVTFGVRSSSTDKNLTWVACLGLPGTRVSGCDVQQGDTECSASLPLLCLHPDATGSNAPGEDLKGTWLAARIAASAPVRGSDVGSRDLADDRCAAQFGSGWRVARWSDHGDGFIATGRIRPAVRMWIEAPETSAASCWARR
jgi:hypothetical protein